MKKIDQNNSILTSQEFLSDKYKFELMGHNLGYEGCSIYSDEVSYVIVIGNDSKPIWVWTKDDIPNDNIEDLINKLNMICKNNLDRTIVFKKSVSDKLVCLENGFDSGVYQCITPIKPIECEGHIDSAKEDEVEVLSNYWFLNCIEQFGDEQKELWYNISKKFANSFVKDNNFYVWRNNEGQIVSFLQVYLTDRYGEISKAYTPLEHRGKKYMQNLIYIVSSSLLSKGVIPILSTDLSYMPSNKAYTNVGFEEQDILTEISIKNIGTSKNKKNLK